MIILRENYSSRGIKISSTSQSSQPKDVTDPATCDIAVGNEYRQSSDEGFQQIKKEIVLHPNTAIVIRTAERLTLPDGVFGVVCSKGSLASGGLVVANTKIDPMFDDHLLVPVFNSSGNVIRLTPGRPFASVYFISLERRSFSTAPRKVYFPVHTKRPSFLQFIRQNALQLMIALVTLIASCIGSSIGDAIKSTLHSGNPTQFEPTAPKKSSSQEFTPTR